MTTIKTWGERLPSLIEPSKYHRTLSKAKDEEIADLRVENKALREALALAQEELSHKQLVLNETIVYRDQLQAQLDAALAQEPVHQFRKEFCADWYDGQADHEDGHGPYEERKLYAAPIPAQQLTKEQIAQVLELLVTSLHHIPKDEPDLAKDTYAAIEILKGKQ